MDKRLQLQTLLETLLGSRNVYFQPPSNIQMKFPAIIYERDNSWVEHASNLPYAHQKRYQVTVVDPNPDSLLPDKVEKLPLCSFNRHFVVDNLNHNVFSIYF